MKQLLLTLVFASAIVTCLPVCAANPVQESLEWLVTSRPSIAVETVTNTAPVSVAGTNSNTLTIETHLTETLKGHPPQQASFVRHWQPGEVPGQNDAARPENGTEYMLFFDDHGQVTNAINLKFPSRRLGIGTDVKDVATDIDFTILKSGEVVRDAVRRRLARLPKDVVAGTANAPAFISQQVSVPIDSPAWTVLCDGGACDILVPDDAQNKSIAPLVEEPVLRIAEFSGPAFEDECHALPKKAFEVKSMMAGQPNTLLIGCSRYPDGGRDPQKLSLTFKVKDILREADYTFQWDLNPDAPQKGFFTDKKTDCEVTARTLQFRAPGPVPFGMEAGAPEVNVPMSATWKDDCVPNDRWGYVIVFELSVRYGRSNGHPVTPLEDTAPKAALAPVPAGPLSATAPAPSSPLLAPGK